MIKPLVSIIIPVYNGANYLAEAIDSALAQTYENIEIIVVNDGSNDGGKTEAIALSYGERIKYIAKENGGSSSALNVGIKNMTGDYFSWLSHDDLYTPEKIEQSVKKIDPRIKENQVIICGSCLIDADGSEIFHPKKSMDGEFSSAQMLKKLSNGFGINGCSVLLSKKIIDGVGFFDESLVYVNDTDYWYRLILSDCAFTCFTDKLVKTRMHSGQVSVKKAELFKKERKIFEKKFYEELFNKEKDVAMIKDFMKYTMVYGDVEIARAVVGMLAERNIKYGWCLLFIPIYVSGRVLEFLKVIYKKIFLRR